MSVFDIIGLASKVPFDLIQKLEGDLPKLQKLQTLVQQAEPHVNALMPIVQEAESVWNSISPDVMTLIGTLQEKQP